MLKSRDKALEIENDIKDLIRKKELRPDDRIVSENALRKMYDANLYQVRKAIRNLIAGGRLYSKSKSGVFVASSNNELNVQTVSTPGLNLFEIVGIAKCTLNFMVGCWNIADASYWKKIAYEYSRQNSSVEITIVFPRDYTEYLNLQKTCDMMYTTPWEVFRSYSNYEKLEPFTLDESASWPIREKYLKHIVHGQGVVGIPVTSTFLVGSIADQLVPDVIVRRTLLARDWEELFMIFQELNATSISALPVFNLHQLLTLNAYHFLRIAGGDLLDLSKTMIDMRKPEISRTLELIDRYRSIVIYQKESNGDRKCLFDIFYDNNALLTSWHLQNTPWLYPVQNNAGEYPEAQGICCIFKQSHNIEEAKKFLTFLHTVTAQKILNDCPTSNGIAENIEDKIFNKYPQAWRDVLKKIKDKTFIFGEYIPGYNEFLHNVFHPEIKRFFLGDISIAELVSIVQAGGNKIIGKYKTT